MLIRDLCTKKLSLFYYSIVDPHEYSILLFPVIGIPHSEHLDQFNIAQNMLTIVYWRFSDVQL